MSRRRRRVMVVVGSIAALLAACRPGADTARGVAERFLDEHYVRMDLRAAAEHCVGLARHKVEEELRLVGGEEIDASTMKPTVTYELEEVRDDGDGRSNFLYRGKVKLSGGHSFDMRWLISVKRDAGEWKVSNFKEMP